METTTISGTFWDGFDTLSALPMNARLWILMAGLLPVSAPAADSLVEGWENPPVEARLRAYWWWLNGYVTRSAITRDLEEMKARGFGGALICDAGGAEQDGNDRVPHGPDFLSPEWRELYKHTLREAARLGLEMSLNIQSGWNLGGPMVKPEDAAKKLVWSETRLKGPGKLQSALPIPKHRDNFYRDLFVVAYPLKPGVDARRRPPISNWEEKALYRALHFSAPDTTPLLRDNPPVDGEEDTKETSVRDLTGKLKADGMLEWEAPDGEWVILRFGFTPSDHSRVSTSSDNWKGYAIDVLDLGAFRRYWDAVVEPLIADAGPMAGRTLKYLHTDSWEVEAINWTPSLREEFRKRRGYDMLARLPVLAGRIVDSRPASNRFLNDYRKTIGELAVDNHYKPFSEWAHRHGLQIHPESGGPHAVPIDAQRCLGINDVPMSEFWAWSWRHRVGEQNRFFVKQPASAAHTCGRRLVAAEGFTTIGPHWQETLWDNLKPSFDQAACEGLNLLVWHAFVCSPQEAGVPGIQYFAGTHFNPNSTWWPWSGAFLSYINRCQWLLQQGQFVADVCYYYGDHVPNFAQYKRTDPARVLPGFDYDVITEFTLVSDMGVKDKRLVLPGGMSYRVLVLPDRPAISVAALRKVRELVEGGATVIGSKPVEGTSLSDLKAGDAEVKRIADALWGEGKKGIRKVGMGRVVTGMTARELMIADGLKPDFELLGGDEKTGIDYIHRRVGETDIYFVANRSNRIENVRCLFRVSGKAPEFWDPVSGRRQFASAYQQMDGQTAVPIEFAPYGSWFVIFREPAASHLPVAERNQRRFVERHQLTGGWNVRFDPQWGGPASVEFDTLLNWKSHTNSGIKYYSGAATYSKTFDLPEQLKGMPFDRLCLDLGDVRELAEVRLNGLSLGVLWARPMRAEIGAAVKPSGNKLEITVVNFWPNRIIGDQFLPPEKRFTRTNIRKLTRNTPLMDAGLLGPVVLGTLEPQERAN